MLMLSLPLIEHALLTVNAIAAAAITCLLLALLIARQIRAERTARQREEGDEK